MKELNNQKIEKGTLLQKITDLEDKLMEVQLQLEKFSDNKLAQMLTGQKFSSNKTGLRYVATTDASSIASTSKIVFVKPSIPNSQNTCGDRVKTIVPKSLPTCHHCGMVGHIRSNCGQLNSSKTWKDTPMNNKGVENDSKSKYVPSHKRLPTHRFVPTYHHCGISGHIRRNYPQQHGPPSALVKKEPLRQAPSGIRPPKRHQDPRHQHGPHKYVIVNHSGKPKKNKSRHYKKKPLKPANQQFYEEMPIIMQNILRWMDHQMKAHSHPTQVCQIWARNDETTHFPRGNEPT